jgi:hypothetical protein
MNFSKNRFYSIMPLNMINLFLAKLPFLNSVYFKKIFFIFDFNSNLFNVYRYSTFSQYIKYKHGTIIEFI